MEEAKNSLDLQLCHTCAGGMVQICPLNSKVFYFPQGHAEHAQAKLGFAAKIPPLILCRVATAKFLADPETDEVYTKMKLILLRNSEFDYDDAMVVDSIGSDKLEKLVSFTKTLTQSDANNGGGFFVLRFYAESIFLRLDYSADSPVQTVLLIGRNYPSYAEIWPKRRRFSG